MRWVFRNEDTVWAARGGRDGTETVGQFIGYLGLGLDHATLLPLPGGKLVAAKDGMTLSDDGSAGVPSSSASVATRQPPTRAMPAFPGVILTLSPSLVDFAPARDVVGYAIGECILYTPEFERRGVAPTSRGTGGDVEISSVDVVGGVAGLDSEVGRPGYEVVTAWVHPSLRSCGAALRMYRGVFARCPHVCEVIEVDVIEGAISRLRTASWAGWACCPPSFLGSLFIADCRPSYSSHTISGIERFEKVVFWRRSVAAVAVGAEWVDDILQHAASFSREHVQAVTMAATVVAVVGAFVVLRRF